MVIWNSVFLKGVLKIILRKLRLFKIQAIAQGVVGAVERKKAYAACDVRLPFKSSATTHHLANPLLKIDFGESVSTSWSTREKRETGFSKGFFLLSFDKNECVP